MSGVTLCLTKSMEVKYSSLLSFFKLHVKEASFQKINSDSLFTCTNVK